MSALSKMALLGALCFSSKPRHHTWNTSWYTHYGTTMQARAEMKETQGSCKCEHFIAQVTRERHWKPMSYLSMTKKAFQTEVVELNLQSLGYNVTFISTTMWPKRKHMNDSRCSAKSLQVTTIDNTSSSKNSCKEILSRLRYGMTWLHQAPTELVYLPIRLRPEHTLEEYTERFVRHIL